MIFRPLNFFAKSLDPQKFKHPISIKKATPFDLYLNLFQIPTSISHLILIRDFAAIMNIYLKRLGFMRSDTARQDARFSVSIVKLKLREINAKH